MGRAPRSLGPAAGRGAAPLVLALLAVLAAACPSRSGDDRSGQAAPARAKAAKKPPPPDIPEEGPLAQKIFFEQGKSLLRAGRFDRAEEMFRKAIAAHGQGEVLPSCYLGLGSALAEQRKGEEAVKAYREVVELLPGDPDAYRALAMGLEEQGDLKGSAQNLAQALVLDPDQLTAYMDLAAVYLRVNDLESARKVYHSYELRRTRLIETLGLVKDPARRVEAAVALGQARDEATVKALGLALTDSSRDVRLAVIKSLGTQALDAGVGPLKARLQKATDQEEREAIQQSLKSIAASPQPDPGPNPLSAPAPSGPEKHEEK